MDDQKKTDTKSFYFQPQRIWLNIFFFLALILMIILNITSIRQVKYFTIANELLTRTYQIMQASNQIFLNHLNLVAISRGFLLTGDQNFLTNLNLTIHEVNRNFSLVKKLTMDNISQQKKLDKLRPLLDERINILLKMIQFKQVQQLSDNEKKSLIYLGQNVTDKIQLLIESIYEEEFLMLQQRNISIKNNFESNMLIVLLMNSISMFLLLAIIIQFNRKLTEHMLLVKRIRRSEALLEGIINGTTDYIAAIDLNFNYIAFNQTFEKEYKRVFGIKPAIGMNLKDSLVLAPTEIEKIFSLWRRALKGEEFTIISKFGSHDSPDEYEVTFSGIYDDTNKLIGASHIARNVAERIEQERSLKIAKQNIETSYIELKKHDDELSIMNDMNTVLQSASSLDETMAMIKNYCSQLLSFADGALYIIKSSQNYLELVITWNDPQVTDQVLLPDQCWALRQGKVYKHLNNFRDLLCKHILPTEELAPYLCVPLLAQNDIIGLMYLQLKNYSSLSEEQLAKQIAENQFLIKDIAGHISMAIANMKLHEKLKTRSIRDSLTGLYNRAYLDESLSRDVERAKRNHISLAVVMLDLDHFKQINDTFGHEAGDLVLMEIGKLLINKTRKSDMACRYGGEEFFLMFYDVTQEIAFELCENIRKEINKLAVYLGNILIGPISASFGFVMYPYSSLKAEELIKAADKALFDSKKTGRNKVTLYT